MAPRQEPLEGRPAQGVQIRRSDWELHGSTPGCSKCIHADTYGWGQTTLSHSKDCITRYREEYSKTEEGKKRLDKADLRQLRHVERLSRRARAEAQQGTKTEVKFEPVSGELSMPRVVQAEGGQEPQEPEAPPAPLLQPSPARNEDEANHELFGPSEDDEPPTAKADDENMADGDADGDANMQEDVGSLEEIMNLCAEEHIEDLKRDNQEIMQVIRDCGGSRRAYGRERQKAIKTVLSEIYSPPRVTACAKLLPSCDILPGFALDLTTVDAHGVPWDFDLPERRAAARRLVEEQ